MSWRGFTIGPDGAHHVDARGAAAYVERFDEVLKFHAPGLAPVRRGDLAWHIRIDGTPAYDRRFRRTFGFYEGLAAVVDADGWHHITPEGRDAYAQRYAWCGNVQDGCCTVREADGSYLHIDAEGQPAYAARWRYAGDFRDGNAVVQAMDGRSTHIDRRGRFVHERWFIDLDVFHKGFARARDEDGWMHVDASGEALYGRRFATVEPFYNGQARVERADGGLEIIDEAGATIVELRPALRSELAALSSDLVGFWRTHTIATAVRLGVIEALPATALDVAERCGLHADGARRLLRALGELRLTSCETRRWTLTPRGAYLRADHPMTLADAALEYAGPLATMWSELPDALRAASNRRAPDVFAEVGRDTARRAGHHRMLQSYARHDYAEVGRVIDLRGDEHVIDAAGGLGVLAQIIADAYPRAQVTVLERPEVVELARPSRPRLGWQAADLFGVWPMNADVVLLSRVLHDWDDDHALRILVRARGSLPVGGRLFVLEMLLDEHAVAGSLCDLHLLAVTGGRERTVAEYRRLFEAAGFQLREVRNTAALPAVMIGVAQ